VEVLEKLEENVLQGFLGIEGIAAKILAKDQHGSCVCLVQPALGLPVAFQGQGEFGVFFIE
jgi:hypothetical protein